jgi:hypothetical protein
LVVTGLLLAAHNVGTELHDIKWALIFLVIAVLSRGSSS